MLIVSADDWGRSMAETDLALRCYDAGRVSSVSAMAFMDDSERAASIARDAGIPFGLHLNLSEPYTRPRSLSRALVAAQEKVIRFMSAGRYRTLVYHPALHTAVRDTYRAQLDEVAHRYGRGPTHVDGHHHRHLALNVILGGVIPRDTKVRRTFSFAPGEKTTANRVYRALLTAYMRRRYTMTRHFFSLSTHLTPAGFTRIVDLSASDSVELMAHPARPKEYAFLLSDHYRTLVAMAPLGSFADLKP